MKVNNAIKIWWEINVKSDIVNKICSIMVKSLDLTDKINYFKIIAI
jgi:hypothetical protein